ncbi:hypothetical protein CFP56_002711 [Quercus suber]|uniref:Uncharacterized protein n=1 Tax=Quercus suber TaxID=58331 RepID=A0AAW0IJW9_QUESU
MSKTCIYTQLKFYTGHSMFRVCHLPSRTNNEGKRACFCDCLYSPKHRANFCKQAICRVIGAIVIAMGLYMVLWGKSKDQQRSKSDNEEVAPTANMATMNERITTSKSM